MKKSFLILLLLAAALIPVGCIKPPPDEGRDGSAPRIVTKGVAEQHKELNSDN